MLVSGHLIAAPNQASKGQTDLLLLQQRLSVFGGVQLVEALRTLPLLCVPKT
jgi:hypothetical protein